MALPTTKDQAFIELVDRYLERVYRYLRNLTRDEETARELAHETFLSLRPLVDAGKPPSEAYVFTTARNTALSNWRCRQSEDRKLAGAEAENNQAGGTWYSDDTATSPTREVERRELRLGLEVAPKIGWRQQMRIVWWAGGRDLSLKLVLQTAAMVTLMVLALNYLPFFKSPDKSHDSTEAFRKSGPIVQLGEKGDWKPGETVPTARLTLSGRLI